MSDTDPGKHDQSNIRNDGWSQEDLQKDQSGNDAQIKILEDAVEKSEKEDDEATEEE